MTDGEGKLTSETVKPTLKSFYEWLYNLKRGKSDSPDEAQIQIRRGLMDILRDDIDPPNVLNIGSGRQLLEFQIMTNYKDKSDKRKKRNVDFYTMDIADIEKDALMASNKFPRVHHLQGDASQLRYVGGYGAVVSSMALDFMPREALSGVAAALAPKGKCIFTLHHPSMMRQILAETKDARVRGFIQYALDNGFFYESAEEIKQVFGRYGLAVEPEFKMENPERSGGLSKDAWWLVKGVKTA